MRLIAREQSRSGWVQAGDSCKERGWKICHVGMMVVAAPAVPVTDAVVDKGLKAEIEVADWS